jgi:hypothetical protein
MAVPGRVRDAIHEAAHAAACLNRGLPLRGAALYESPDGGGFTAFNVPTEPSPDHLFTLLAGAAAEKILCGSSGSEWNDHRADQQMSQTEADRIADGDGPKAAAWMKHARMQAEDFVRTYSGVIQDIAAALHDAGSLEGDEIARIAAGRLHAGYAPTEPPPAEMYTPDPRTFAPQSPWPPGGNQDQYGRELLRPGVTRIKLLTGPAIRAG